MILVSIQIRFLHSTVRNYTLKLRNQIDLDDMLSSCYPNSHYSNSLGKLSLLCLSSILSPKYGLCFHH